MESHILGHPQGHAILAYEPVMVLFPWRAALHEGFYSAASATTSHYYNICFVSVFLEELKVFSLQNQTLAVLAFHHFPLQS
jgi:hypothetical protein